MRPPADPVAGDASTVVVHAIATDERPDRSVVEVDDLPPGRTVATGRLGRVAMRSDTLQLLRSELTTPTGAPPLVLVERIVRDASPVLAELIAFPHAVVAVRAATFGADVAPGSVLTLADAARIGLAAEDQVGAVKWRAGTGQVLEVYVAPAHRRRGVATFLLFSAEGAAAARGWPRLWGGGVRTALGEALVTRLRWGVGRVAPLAEVAPPMTPVEDTLGVPRRHLEPLD
ncbi:GNAT family N-acetyltransferase [Actinotalea ferrariae]|uniref:GNAT family N-acetyltransferase n=1 Tax=Actinotalea ferrariae TaxID=1386098 RepID=UPI001C8CA044|nr:GNAT family N-acetyltransferase [Actinotalea ferrariae]MBX9244718.1 GNAT family N-acetyltransferase [Actinotalea ferrariae]